jgi:hypothetical protein
MMLAPSSPNFREDITDASISTRAVSIIVNHFLIAAEKRKRR